MPKDSQLTGKPKRVAVIGGGAAGFFAAINIAEADPSASVQLIEASRKTLTKVSISGGGRCNVTHSCFDPRELVRHYPRGEKELRGAFHKWQPQDTIDWFAQREVELKTEPDGRMFPVTDDSQTIVNCLTRSAEKAGVQLSTKSRVIALNKLPSGELNLDFANGESRAYSQVVVATGGSQKNVGHAMASSMGHTIAELAPSLFTFHIDHPLLTGLQGLSLAKVQTSYPPAKLQQSGPVVFTHWGLSGPGILKLSAWGARHFFDCDYKCELIVNWAGGSTLEKIRADLEAAKNENARKALVSVNPFDFPRRFWERLLEFLAIPSETQWAQLSKKHLNSLAQTISRTQLQTDGKSMNKDEFVTCGGVNLKEVDLKTMQSRLVPNLYFAGEVLDIDGVTGGFNFQAAWTTAQIAALAIAET